MYNSGVDTGLGGGLHKGSNTPSI